jgi:fructose-bisphosphate aldolase class II
MLVNATAMLRDAVKGGYGIAAFNTNNLEWARSILTAAEKEQSPVIVQCTSGAAKWQTSFKLVSQMVHTMVETMGITVPVALHLDHGTYEDCLTCIDAGFTSIMYDGSKEETFELNLQRTSELVKLAHAKGLSIEAEVGGIGGVEDGSVSMGEIADPEQCLAIANTGVDCLACGIGNIHGLYPDNWAGLQFDVLATIKEKVGDLPLVLHGGTGIPADQIKRAISMGIAKINVNTDLQVAFARATRGYIEAGLDMQGKGYDPRKLLKPGAEAIVERACEIIEEFGSAGKASSAGKKAKGPVEIPEGCVSIDQFGACDIRVCKVLACDAVPKSKKLLRFDLDDGSGVTRQILSGIHAWYEPEQLVGKTILAILNLPTRKMMGLDSNGMILSAIRTDEDGNEDLHLIMLDDAIPAGAQIG